MVARSFSRAMTVFAVAITAIVAAFAVPASADSILQDDPGQTSQQASQQNMDGALQTAALSAPQLPPVALPQVLNDADVARYRKIFALQKKGAWDKADHVIKTLSDPLLMGHVQAQRYLHPTKYRSKYKELKAWLAVYGDHPSAQQIYKLALKRRPANYTYPKRPPSGRSLYTAARGDEAVDKPKRKRLNRDQRRRVARLKNAIKSHLRQGHTLAVKKLLKTRDVKKLFDAYNMDWARGRLAKGYFMDGRDQWAVEWAEKAAKRSGKYLPNVYWIAGLAQWRLGNMDQAARQFELSAQYDAAPWTHAASSFWAARAYLIARQPQRVTALLDDAAEHPRTFYGMLASRLLGREPDFNWAIPEMDGSEVQALLRYDGGRRALALLQIGENVRAEKEMRQTARLAPRELSRGMLAIAARTGMAQLTMRLDAMLYPDGGGFDGAAYPLPSWEPGDGFKVDRALIYALVRQESRFNPKAKSGAGARGLMQLMPGTASFVARDQSLRRHKRAQLFDPALNLKLGQKYISILLSDEKIQGDLFLMAAAWNGGPGNLNKWRRNVNDMDDALFFIESLPSRETRIFIERVLTNLWIYRDRLGQTSPSLDSVASGSWPLYSAQGEGRLPELQEVADNVEN